MTTTIISLKARQILDSRGNPTVECDVTLSDGSMGRAAVPSGASTGSREVLELRDGGDSYGGKSVRKAIAHIMEDITPLVEGKEPFDQRAIDQIMIDADGTDNKATFGANAILAVSLAVAKAAAISRGMQLHDYIAAIAGTTDSQSLPLPMMNVMNGGQHAPGSTDIQEYMIVPVGASTIDQAVEMGAGVFHALAKVLKKEDYPTTVGDEGGYAPRVKGGNREPFVRIVQAIQDAGYQPGRDIVLAIDPAASEFYKDGKYVLETEGLTKNADEMIDFYQQFTDEFPLVSIEDGLDESDWSAWIKQTSVMGDKFQIVGDDLLVTNTTLLKRGIEDKVANSILIKPNQIGTLSETIDAVMMAKENGWTTVVSHRSGETEDTTIAHIAVGLGAGQIKTGSLSRTDRVSKYNELMRIAEASPSLALAKPFEKA